MAPGFEDIQTRDAVNLVDNAVVSGAGDLLLKLRHGS